MFPARFVLFVGIRRFYIRTLNPDAAKPTVIHRDKLVLDANDTARTCGVTLGMGLSEAKVLLSREGVFVEWQEEPYREAQHRWLDLCAVQADAVEPLDQHEAFVDLSDHPDPQHVRAALLEDLAKSGFEAVSGLAACRWIARIAVGRESDAPLTHAKRFAATLPVQALPLPDGFANRLYLLGCKTVGDVAVMPIDTLRKPFGKDALSIHRLAQGTGEATVQRAYPPDSLSGRFCFEGAAHDREIFDNGLKHLAKTVGVELARRELGGKELLLWVEDEDGDVEELARTYSKPLASPASLLVALRLLCGEQEKAVAKVRLRLPGLTKVKRVQQTLSGVCANSAKKTSSEAALASVRAVFGDGAIQLAADIVEPRYKQVRRAWWEVNGWPWR